MSDPFGHSESNNENPPQNMGNYQPNQECPHHANDGPTAGGAFVKGGCGCLIAFLVLGLSCVAIGGSMHIDLGGVIMLFVIGGVLGLIFLAVYNAGRRSGGGG